MRQIIGQQLKGDTCRFIYFHGFRYEVVSVENYYGMRGFLSEYPTIEGNIYNKVNELNAPLEASMKAHKAFIAEVASVGEYPTRLFTYEYDEAGLVRTVWAYDDIHPSTRAKFPNVGDRTAEK